MKIRDERNMNTKLPMTVRARLSIGFGTLLALLLLVAATGILRLGALNDSFKALADDRVPKIITGGDWLFSVSETARHTRNMLILDSDDLVKKEVESVMGHKKMRKDYMEICKLVVA